MRGIGVPLAMQGEYLPHSTNPVTFELQLESRSGTATRFTVNGGSLGGYCRVEEVVP